MVGLAEARRESLSAEGLQLYARMLSRFDIRDVQATIARIAEERRGDYETKLPDLGELKARVEETERRRTHIPWEPCRDCQEGTNGHMSGVVIERLPGGRSRCLPCECVQAWKRKKAQAAPADAVEDRKAKAAGE